MAEYRVGAITEFPAGSHRLVQAGRLTVGIYNLDGELHALPNVCPHQFGPLSEGKVHGAFTCTAESGFKHAWIRSGEFVTCPWHGIEFDIRTGKSLASPRLAVRPYRVRVEGEDVYVSTDRRSE